MKPIPFAVDFDGTCCTHDYPEIGKDIGAQAVLKEMVAKGHQLILFTMRSGKQLEEAVDWFSKNDIELFGVQFHPTQHTWTDSNKCYAKYFIDDAALGVPLTTDLSRSPRPFVDWLKIREMLVDLELL
jgi:hypothetical protein